MHHPVADECATPSPGSYLSAVPEHQAVFRHLSVFAVDSISTRPRPSKRQPRKSAMRHNPVIRWNSSKQSLRWSIAVWCCPTAHPKQQRDSSSWKRFENSGWSSWKQLVNATSTSAATRTRSLIWFEMQTLVSGDRKHIVGSTVCNWNTTTSAKRSSGRWTTNRPSRCSLRANFGGSGNHVGTWAKGGAGSSAPWMQTPTRRATIDCRRPLAAGSWR